jgi:dienelactone hydrolase
MGMIRRLLRATLWLLLLGTMSMAGLLLALWLRHNQDVVLPAPGGPFAVGRVGYDWVDQARPETLRPEINAQRELMVWVWYPAAPPHGAAPAPYLPENWAAAIAQDGGAGAFLAQNLGHVHAHAVADAPLASTSNTFPVLLLEPGYGHIATDYSVLAEDLASHGYVVVGVTPTYSASVVVFPDGRVARRTPEGSIPEDSPDAARPVLDRLVAVWAADDQFALDQMTHLNAADPAGRFTGRLDMANVGALGHSLGGAAAAQFCHVDQRCKAGVDLDGTLYSDVVRAGLSQPFMFIWSEPDDPTDAEWQHSTRDANAVFATLPHGYQVTVHGARHFNFADMAVLYAPAFHMLGALGPIDGQRGLAITTTYVRAFFDSSLKQQTPALLANSASDPPDVQIERR